MARIHFIVAWLAVSLLLAYATTGQAVDGGCDATVIDVAPMGTATSEDPPGDVEIVLKRRTQLEPGRVFKVFRPETVSDRSGKDHALMLYLGRMRVIDVQGDVVIGRITELAARDEHPRVRYETIMLGDCLELELADMLDGEMLPEGLAEIAPDSLSAEVLDVSALPSAPQPGVVSIRRVIPSRVLFEFDSSRIRTRWSKELEELAEFIAAQRPAKVVIEGHADWIGTDAYNIGLSRRRAQAMIDYLVANHGLDRNLFDIEAYGERRPVASNETDEGRQLNRRAVANLLFRMVPTTEAAKAVTSARPLSIEAERILPEEAELPVIDY